MKEQAIVPDFFRPAIDSTTKIIKSKPRKGDDELLAEMGESDAWKKLKSIIEGKIAKVEHDSRVAMRQARSLDEIGLLSALADIASLSYQNIIDIVELRVKAKNLRTLPEHDRP